MSSITIAFVFSVIGAILLFCSGYLLAVIRLTTKQENDNSETYLLKQALSAREYNVTELTIQIMKLREEMNNLQSSDELHNDHSPEINSPFNNVPNSTEDTPAQFLENQLNTMLEKFSAQWSGNHDLVLADKYGRLFNRSGEYSKSLAMLGAIFHKLNKNLPLFLQNGKISEFTFSECLGDQKITIFIIPLELFQQQFYLISRYEENQEVPNKFNELIENLSSLLEELRLN